MISSIFTAEKKALLADRVAEQIRISIRSGKLKPGQRLVETELAQAMDVNRFAIREAIRTLREEGLVANAPYRGTHVTELTATDLEEIHDLRKALEVLAIQRISSTLNGDMLRRLEAALERMHAAAASDADLCDFVAADLDFHGTICELSNNRRLVEAWKRLSCQISSFIAADNTLYGGTRDKVYAEHRGVFENIAKRDFTSAARQLAAIVDDGYQLAMRYLNEKRVAEAEQQRAGV